MGMEKPKNQKSVGYMQLLRQNIAFRHLWSGQVISLLGDWFNLIASASLIAVLTQSGAAVGGLFVVRMLAPFLMSPIAGVVADRYNRRRIVMTTDILRGFTVLCFVLVREPEHVWLVYALTAVQSALQGFFFPAWNSILPDITKPEELGTANALSSSTWSVMLAFGAALGGIFSGVLGIYPAFIIDGLTFFVSAFILSRMPYEPEESLGDKSVMAAFRQYFDGLNYLRQHIDILVIALHKAVNGLLVVGVYQVVQVTIAERHFPVGEGGSISLGLLYFATGVGTGIGPILARHIAGDRDRAIRIAIAFGYVASLLGLYISSTLASFEVVMIGTLLRGIGGGIVWVQGTQLLLQLLPNNVRGRVISTEFMLNTLGTAIASGVSGALLDTTGTVTSILQTNAVILIVPIVLWSLWIMFGKREQLQLA